MKRLFFSMLRQYLFWMFFFFILRAIFVIYHADMIAAENISLNETLLSFWYSLKLDTATTGYILLFPALILFIQGLFGWKWLNLVPKIYSLLIILAWVLITAVELGSFSEWKYKLTTTAFVHLQNVMEAYYSITPLQFFSLLAFTVILTWGSYYLFRKIFYMEILERVKPIYFPIVFFVIIIPSLFVMLRGGFNDISISQSAAHYSHHSILNWASVNSGYHFAVNVMETSRYHKSHNYQFYDIEEARKTVENIHKAEKDTTIRIIDRDKPNIVILLMESWTADIIESLGAEPGITPEFAKLEKEGLLFTRFYSTGNRSHEGTASILGGHPALPYTTFTANPVKFGNMPSMIRQLNEAGYHSSFYYGGQLDYGNMRAYLLFNQFDEIVEENDIDASIPRGRLGVHDEFLYQRHINDLAGMKEPFISVIFTLSSHSPYDFPMDPVISWGGTYDPFLNSAYYADKCLGRYVEEARKQPWFENTLFVLVADHGHSSYKNYRYESYEFHHTPLFFFGGALKDEFRGKQNDRVGDNSSIPKTLVAQLGLPTDQFKWGSNLFNPYAPEFAYVVLNDGYAWKTPDAEIVYAMNWKHFYKKEFPEGTSQQEIDRFIRDGKSYVQVLFQEFLDLY